MIKKISILIAFFLVLLSIRCSIDEKEMMQREFEQVRDYVRMLDESQFNAALDSTSQRYLREIRSPKNQYIDSVIAIGYRYGVPYVSIKYFSFCRGEISEDCSLEFMIRRYPRWFNLTDEYEFNRVQTRVGTNNFLALVSKEPEQKRIKWIKFNKEEGRNFKLDLLYFFKIEEREEALLYDNLKKNKQLSDKDVFMTIMLSDMQERKHQEPLEDFLQRLTEYDYE